MAVGVPHFINTAQAGVHECDLIGILVTLACLAVRLPIGG
jgi:hypothetical protein